MERIELIATCNFGVEAVLKEEIINLGYDIRKVEDGRITFMADVRGIAMANIWLRTAERIHLKMAEFSAYSFEELFQNVKKIEWERWIKKTSIFPVKKAVSLKSRLYSTPDVQAITKKAVVERLKTVYKVDWLEESGEEYPIHVFINKNNVTITIDTSGDSLYKRGYKERQSEASIKETLAALMVTLTPWNESRELIDPFCGAGTILIEAAMIGLNIAPGLNRKFVFENWSQMNKEELKSIKKQAFNAIKNDLDFKIQGYDTDEQVLKIARENAENAGVADYIHFQKRDARDISSSKKYGFIITNPPYGERMEDKATVEVLYRDIGKAFKKLDTWSFYIITSNEDFEGLFGRRADKKRKLYNGMLKTNFYSFLGPKPKRI
ncbi:MAG: N-6 DNA methylase [Clostridiales bacterium GWE2_32_10]|nr:MAG: N-6 DNA methylase [Clostridiales bacterium GWE2_32_10]HBY20949.1 RNA methyltransferase [Clostridiales bacterium]